MHYLYILLFLDGFNDKMFFLPAGTVQRLCFLKANDASLNKYLNIFKRQEGLFKNTQFSYPSISKVGKVFR